jgi:hypothetical protein
MFHPGNQNKINTMQFSHERWRRPVEYSYFLRGTFHSITMYGHIQGGAMNHGLLFAGPLPLPFGGCEQKD